jgi:hypothetical protein
MNAGRFAVVALFAAAWAALSACGGTVVVDTGGGGSSRGGGAQAGAGASSTVGDTRTCTTIITWYSQCMCGDMAVDGIDMCQIGEACGTDRLFDAGGCFCQQVNVPGPCR